jgi:AraC family transcriptional regulator, ethanolamine operon transcriptional activator
VNIPTSAEAVAVTVIETTDPVQANAGIELLDLDAVQLRSGTLNARSVVVRAGRAALVFHSSNVRLRTRTSCEEGLVAFIVFGPQATGTANGVPVRPELMLAAGLGVEAGFVIDPGWESLTLLLPDQDLEAHLAAQRRSGLLPPPGEVVVLAGEPALANDLFAWGSQLAETAAARPETFHDRDGLLTALEGEICAKLLATIGTARVLEPSRSDRTRQRRSRIVMLAEKHALQQVGANLYVTDLCRITGVSERALEYAFKEVMGMTPVAFLAKLRLHRVRQALLEGGPEPTTVASEALRWGFGHFGEFARAYSKCFGELPSETLARNRHSAKRR